MRFNSDPRDSINRRERPTEPGTKCKGSEFVMSFEMSQVMSRLRMGRKFKVQILFSIDSIIKGSRWRLEGAQDRGATAHPNTSRTSTPTGQIPLF